MSVAMTTPTCGRIAYILNCRYIKATSLRRNILWSNPAIVALNIALQALIIYTPGIQDAFALKPITALAWLRCAGIAVAVFFIVEAEKIVGPPFMRRARECLPARLPKEPPPLVNEPAPADPEHATDTAAA